MNPESVAARKDEIQSLLRAGRTAEALVAARTLCAHDPKNPESWYLCGCACGSEKKFHEGEQCFHRALALNPGHDAAALYLARTLDAQGKTDEAIEAYRALLALRPDHAAAWRALGSSLYRLGRLVEAGATLTEALRSNPDSPDLWMTLGNVRYDQGDLAGAETAFREVLVRDPGHIDAHLNLGATLCDLGRFAEAIALYQALLALRPGHAAAHNNLGLALFRQGEHARAVEHYRAALAGRPDYPEAQLNLALALRALGRLEEAENSLVEALGVHPGNVEMQINLGLIKAGQGHWGEALVCAHEARRLGPNSFENWRTLGTIFAEAGRRREAIDCYREALRINPRESGLWNDVAVLHAVRLEIGLGLECAREALRCDPDCAPAHHALADLHRRRGELDEAIVCHHAVRRLDPDNPALANGLLSCLNYHPAWTPQAIFEEHRRWGQQYAQLPADRPVLPNVPSPDRRLKIGYVSPDFRSHSVAFFFEPILRMHDRDQFEIACYSEASHVSSDATTEHLKGLANHWVDTHRMSDRELDRKIRDDGIDILVDLAGHTANNRLLAMAGHPAPVQITYIGYPATTGLPAMDYRITDAWADPPGQERFYTEELVRLPSGFLCYQPPIDAPEVGPPPVASAGHFTFGSFNMLEKTTTEVVARWAQILNAVPESRLVLKAPALADESTRDRYTSLFGRAGVTRERIELLQYLPSRRAHLELYNRIDLALDTFPYNGTTTTCEALWMGVPVLVLEGNRHAARVGVSLMNRLGLTEFVARNDEDYVARAVRFANRPKDLADVRSGLRARMHTSRMCDAAGFTHDLEAAYRALWRRWCARSRLASPEAGT